MQRFVNIVTHRNLFYMNETLIFLEPQSYFLCNFQFSASFHILKYILYENSLLLKFSKDRNMFSMELQCFSKSSRTQSHFVQMFLKVFRFKNMFSMSHCCFFFSAVKEFVFFQPSHETPSCPNLFICTSRMSYPIPSN